jgi:hypothetical protein
MKKIAIFGLAALAAAACTGDVATGPISSSASVANANRDQSNLPGSRRTPDALSGKFVPANCSPRHTSQQSALIGPSGGILRIGPHLLIIPAGALNRKVLISGTVPEGRPFQIDLQPHGLQFRKAAGLILDASSCIDVPDIVYLIDQYTQSPPIRAIYSEWWKTIACPIWHFSGYAILLGEHSDEGSAQ